MAIIEPIGPPGPEEPRQPWWRSLAWFLAIAVGSLIAVGVVAYGLKALLPPH